MMSLEDRFDKLLVLNRPIICYANHRLARPSDATLNRGNKINKKVEERKARAHKVGPVQIRQSRYPGFTSVLGSVLQGIITDPGGHN